MPAVYDRIPTSAFDADALVGPRRAVSLGVRTSLRRNDDGEVDLVYKAMTLCTYRVDGGIRLPTFTNGRMGRSRRAVLRRVERVLPRGWEFEPPSPHRPAAYYNRRFPFLVYRGGYRVEWSDALTFLPSGGVDIYGYSISLREMDNAAAESAGADLAPTRNVVTYRVPEGEPRYALPPVERVRRRREREAREQEEYVRRESVRQARAIEELRRFEALLAEQTETIPPRTEAPAISQSFSNLWVEYASPPPPLSDAVHGYFLASPNPDLGTVMEPEPILPTLGPCPERGPCDCSCHDHGGA